MNPIKILDLFVKHNFDERLSVKAGVDFAYYDDEFLITVNKDVLCVNFQEEETHCDDIMMTFLMENFDLPEYCARIFPLVELLHEVGHFMTYDDITLRENNKIMRIKAEIDSQNGELNDDTDEWREGYIRYMCLKDEWLASEWACNWIVEHIELFELLTENIFKTQL